MRVDRVQARSFRCYPTLDCGFSGSVSALIGRNGAGKTSVIEAIHVALLAWSPRTTDDHTLVRQGETVMRATVHAVVASTPTVFAVGYEPGRPKRMTIDGVSVRSADALAARSAVLVFTPDRLTLIKGSPSLRRRYADRAVTRLWPRYAGIATNYATVVTQRNHLLKRIRANAASTDGLATWDQQLAMLGAEVCAARIRLIERLRPGFSEHLGVISDVEGELELRYEPSGPTDVDGMLALLEERRRADIDRAVTSVGPHHDDLAFLQESRDLRIYGSQGEQRSAVVALLLAEADLVHEIRSIRPLMLLDDVASELDARRVGRLIEAVAARGQVIVTTTEADVIEPFADEVIAVEDGALTRA